MKSFFEVAIESLLVLFGAPVSSRDGVFVVLDVAHVGVEWPTEFTEKCLVGAVTPIFLVAVMLVAVHLDHEWV